MIETLLKVPLENEIIETYYRIKETLEQPNLEKKAGIEAASGTLGFKSLPDSLCPVLHASCCMLASFSQNSFPPEAELWPLKAPD